MQEQHFWDIFFSGYVNINVDLDLNEQARGENGKKKTPWDDLRKKPWEELD